MMTFVLDQVPCPSMACVQYSWVRVTIVASFSTATMHRVCVSVVFATLSGSE